MELWDGGFCAVGFELDGGEGGEVGFEEGGFAVERAGCGERRGREGKGWKVAAFKVLASGASLRRKQKLGASNEILCASDRLFHFFWFFWGVFFFNFSAILPRVQLPNLPIDQPSRKFFVKKQQQEGPWLSRKIIKGGLEMRAAGTVME